MSHRELLMEAVPCRVLGCGLLVIEKGYALAGLTPKLGRYSGIGGKQHPGETLRQTAFRESLEELYGIAPSTSLVNTLVVGFKAKPLIDRGGYYYILMSFADFNSMCSIVKTYVGDSPYYKTFPASVLDLVLNRYPSDEAEITELTLVKYSNKSSTVDAEFINDCLLAEKILKPLHLL